MNNLINSAQELLKEQSQQGHNLPPGNKAFGGAYPAGGGFFGRDDDDDDDQTADAASRQAGPSGDKDLFSSILGAMGSKRPEIQKEDIDEEDAIKKHKKFFGDDDDDNDADDKGLGAAAAMQALKMFTSGEPKASQSQGAFLALAMSEGAKLFDQKEAQGKVASGTSKESAVQQAGEMALKMYMKSQGQQQPGGLMGFASKFM